MMKFIYDTLVCLDQHMNNDTIFIQIFILELCKPKLEFLTFHSMEKSEQMQNVILLVYLQRWYVYTILAKTWRMMQTLFKNQH